MYSIALCVANCNTFFKIHERFSSSKIEHSCPSVVGRLPQADGVLHLNDGRYALLEFKPGTKEIEEGAKHLLEIEPLQGGTKSAI